ncbi:hypothetical protein LEP1GSC124_2932 [Leptospira interrogans serovar Pyrogenes str. 200701872]|uniref:Uncharacterized protein n=1 Tax=Leptospira interrogans serovar Pyrogenes str. 200701872 TaxID=1193029 RepID=M6ZW91_LEPIR|nr:hypothetical protein LEP1GSC124_2932 [Leptospira interrogans serovar Pyrogenes str. 200701872]
MRIEELLFSDQPFMIFDEGFHPFGEKLYSAIQLKQLKFII